MIRFYDPRESAREATSAEERSAHALVYIGDQLSRLADVAAESHPGNLTHALYSISETLEDALK